MPPKPNKPHNNGKPIVQPHIILTKKPQNDYVNNISTKSSKDILIDTAIVYTFVPFWLTLFASILQWCHENLQWDFYWKNDGDLLIFPFIFLTIAVPLTYLRFKACKPSHFLHSYRVETDEIFIKETRENLPSLFKVDILMNIGFITSMNLGGIFACPCMETSVFEMWFQSFVLLWLFDASTYWGHRIVHRKEYYKYHKEHHKVRNTVAINLISIDMADFFVNNSAVLLLPFLFNFIGFSMVYEVWIIGFAFVLSQGFIIHSDLYLISARNSLGLYWGDTVVSHSLHHSKNGGHYSFVSPQIWDWICNTAQ